MSEWRTIDSAPKDGTSVLGSVRMKSGRSYAIVSWFECGGSKGWWNDAMEIAYGPELTHWMPLPAQPA